MKTKQLFKFFLISVLSISFLSSCLDDSDNIITDNSLAIIKKDEGKTYFLSSYYGVLYSEAFQQESYMWYDGTPVIVNFTLNYDNQPSGVNYYEVTVNGSLTELQNYAVRQKTQEPNPDNVTLIESMLPYTPFVYNNYLIAPDSKFFLGTSMKDKEKPYSFVATYEQDDKDDEIYMITATAIETSLYGSKSNTPFTFDFNSFITTEGKNKGKDKLKINIRYANSLKNGELEYQDIFTEPLILWEADKED